MLFTLDSFVKRGSIDNTTRGITYLILQGTDESRPLELRLEGDCCSDLAGSRLNFENGSFSDESEEPWDFLRHLNASPRDWRAGDITLSGRRRESNNRGYVTNYLSIEFFSGASIRLLLESECVQYELAETEWSMDWAESNCQSMLSMDCMRDHIQHCLSAHLKGLRMTDSDFPRCEWDDVLNRAETSINIANSIRGKYVTAYSEQACLAYVFDLPLVLKQLADEEESNNPPPVQSSPSAGLVLFDYLEEAVTHSVKKAMEHPLFQCTSRLTDLSFSSLNEAVRLKVCSSEQIHELRVKYSVVVSRILASILMVEADKPYKLSVVNKRINLIKNDLRSMIASLPKKQSILDSFKDGAVDLIASLDDFSRAISRR